MSYIIHTLKRWLYENEVCIFLIVFDEQLVTGNYFFEVPWAHQNQIYLKLHINSCTGFYDDLKKNMEAVKRSHHYYRENWGIDACKLKKRGGNINTVVYFNYCKAMGKFPVSFMIVLLKPFPDSEE